MAKDEKTKELDKAIAELNARYKRDLIFKGKDKDLTIKRVSTGLKSLDRLMGGGLPKGRWTMFYGQKGCGKTSLSHLFEGKVQEEGGKVVHIDAEHSFDPEYAATLGVNVDDLILVKPETLEEAETAVLKMAPVVDLIVVDSIVAVASDSEIDRELEKDTMALIPRKLSQFFRITTPVVGKSNCIVILINQTRQDLGAYVPMERYPGGNALAHYASFIMKMRRSHPDDFPKKTVEIEGKEKEVDAGIRVIAKAEKCKIAATEGSDTFFDLLKEPPHIDVYSDMLNMAEILGLIERAGAYYTFADKKVQGKDKLLDELRKDDKFFKKLEEEVDKNDKHKEQTKGNS